MKQAKETSPAEEAYDHTVFLREVASNIKDPLQQINQLSHIGLQRVRRKQTRLAGDYLAEVQMLSEELLIYVEDLLEITSIKSGKTDYQLEIIDIPELLQSFHRRFAPIAANRNISLDLACQGRYSCVLADHFKLSKVLSTLLRNAFRYIHDGGKISISSTHIDDKVYIHVADNGRGVTPEQASRLFDMYDQNTLLEHRKIMGFGLSICKELMSGQNGNIWLDEPKAPYNTVFTLSIPAADYII